MQIRPILCTTLLLCCAPLAAQPTDQEVARSVAERAYRAAVAAPGARVCRLMTAGISEREWVRGTVVEAGPRDVSIRIEDAGRLSHEVNGTAVVRGAIVRDAPTAWTPCD